MVDRRVVATIAMRDGRGTERCHGPAWDGHCPRPRSDGTIPCAGGRILPLRGTAADGVWLAAPGGAGTRCPLAGLVSIVTAPWD
jgi:hypothetical protein